MSELKNNPKTWVEKVGTVQIFLASIVGTIIFVIWVSYSSVVVNIYKPNGVEFLAELRMRLATLGLLITCFIGVKAIGWLGGQLIDLLQTWKKVKAEIELKKDSKDEGIT